MIIEPEERARASAEFYLLRVREQADAYRDLIYPGGQTGPELWLDLIFGLLETADRHLKTLSVKRKRKYPNAKYLESAIDCTDTAYAFMERLNGSDISEMHYPVVKPMHRWFDALGIKNPVLFRASHVANYEIDTIDEDVCNWVWRKSKSLRSTINKITWPFVHVSVPTKAYSILPHFAVVAHEVGHMLYQQIGDKLYKKIESKCEHGYNKARQRISKRIRKRSVDREEIQSVFKSWIEELTADAFACYVTGPAIFFALSDILQLGPDRRLPFESHPAPRIRLNFLYEALSKGPHDFRPIIKGRKELQGIDMDIVFNSFLIGNVPNVDDIYSYFYVNKIYGKEKSAIIAELNEELPNIGNDVYRGIYEYLVRNHSDLIYTPDHLENDLKNFLNPLIQAVPPIESGIELFERKPASFLSILNVGWIALLCKLDEFEIDTSGRPDYVVRGMKAEALHGLLLKAVELSEIRRQWFEA